ncbi:MAG: hypothetical protein J1F23_08725 [Oscillospiraceae bacterium]|nr:hypothetical protein [Oscillospiraceae bacterium]
MKKLLFILFFPITVPIYIFIKLVIFTANIITDHFIPFLQYDVFPKIKQYFREKSAKMQENAKKALSADSPKDKNEIEYLPYKHNVTLNNTNQQQPSPNMSDYDIERYAMMCNAYLDHQDEQEQYNDLQ